MKRVDDFRLRFGDKEYVPIMIGGMGVDISTSELALEAARLGLVRAAEVAPDTVLTVRFTRHHGWELRRGGTGRPPGPRLLAAHRRHQLGRGAQP